MNAVMDYTYINSNNPHPTVSDEVKVRYLESLIGRHTTSPINI